jgi:endonuclease/exonuclease/phosphatase family metal-dependent hydrolase
MMKLFSRRAQFHAISAPAAALAALLLGALFFASAPLAQDAPPPSPNLATQKEAPAAATHGQQPASQIQAVSPPAEGQTGGIFRIASYNVGLLFDEHDDPNTEDEIAGTKSPESLEALAAVLKNLDAEIVGLQELENKEVTQRFVAAYLPNSGYTVYMDDPQGSIWNVGLLSRFPVKRIVRYGDDNSGYGGESFRFLRHRLVAFQVEVNPEYSFWALVVHLKAMSDERSKEMRVEMARAARDFLTKRLGLDPQKDNIAIMGDFNDTPLSPTIQAFVSDKAFLDTAALNQVVELTHSSDEPTRQIDYVIVSWGMSAEFLPDGFRVPSSPGLDALSRASDHLPVIAAFMDRDTGPSAVERRDMFQRVAPKERSEYLALVQQLNANQVIAEKRQEQLVQAMAGATSGDPAAANIISLGKAREEFLRLEKENQATEAPVIVVEGIAQTPGGALGGDRIQFGFADATGAIMVDAPSKDQFPGGLPNEGDRLRMVGKIIRYRDILEFRPLAPATNLGPAPDQLVPPMFDVKGFAEQGKSREGARVAIKGGVVYDIYRRNNGAIKYTLRSTDPNSNAEAIVYVTQNLPQMPPQASKGQEVMVSGMVSVYQELPQILPAGPADFVIVPPAAKN